MKNLKIYSFSYAFEMYIHSISKVELLFPSHTQHVF